MENDPAQRQQRRGREALLCNISLYEQTTCSSHLLLWRHHGYPCTHLWTPPCAVLSSTFLGSDCWLDSTELQQLLLPGPPRWLDC